MDTTERIIKWRDQRHADGVGSEPHNPLPAVCDVSVTNVCNAACDFCGFSREKDLAGPRRYLDPDEFARALPILRRRRIRYMTLQGGEPLVHPEIASLVASATKAGMQCGVITNGWFLPRYIKPLAAAGLRRLLISIDSADMREHERNRGLRGLEARIREGITQAHSFGIEVCASITVSRLVRYELLPETLNRLGFDAVVFSYPRREAFGSTSLVYDEESKLVDLNTDELLEALSAIARLKKHFRVMDPSAALAEVARFVRGEQQLVPCIGGSKYFYIDWNLDVWRCEAWPEPMGSVFDLDRLPDQRQPCNDCMMGCYRHASILMHGAVAVTDSVYALGKGQLRAAVGLLFQRGVAYSLWALSVEELPRAALISFARRTGQRRSTPQAE
ncbi:radical SAM protein [Paraburkholderia sp. MM5477-R1]|uniref:radical SAM protein n=1 Tax=Paraburkholderia sp. MM5477-R1 TaxID=2991062 RepID=UPI003D24D4E2